MKKRFYLYLNILLLCLCGCEHEIPFERGADTAVLNMTGLLSTSDTLHTVYVNYSTAEEVLDIPHPKLYFYVNDRLVAEGEEVGGYGGRMQFKADFHEGDKVRLVLTALDGMVSAEVEETVPLAATITHVEMDSVRAKKGISYINYEDFIRLRITVADRKGETNYYFPSLATSYTKTVVNRSPWREKEEKSVDAIHDLSLVADYNDFILNDGMVQVDTGDEIFGAIIPNRYMAFSDALFTDAEGTISVYTYPYKLSAWDYGDLIPGGYASDWDRYSTNRRLLVRIHSIDETYFRYLKALNTLDSDNYEPAITDPVSIPSNVRGGVGFVGFSSTATTVIELEDEVFENDIYY